jgi:hypothetical protein
MNEPAAATRCSDRSLLANEPLAGTASVASRFLLLEHGAAWGRDAVADTELPPALRAAAESFDGRVLLLRRPGRRARAHEAIVAAVEEGGGCLRRHAADLSDNGEPLAGPVFLVCTHGRRDPCCARLGGPLYDALAAHVETEALWQSSHQGGHRFAANLLVLPAGIQLGRVRPADAAAVAAAIAQGRVPLGHYRGRTLHAPHVQAADTAVRRTLGLERLDAVRLLEDDGAEVRFAVPGGTARVRVRAVDGPAVPPSCGDEPEPTTAYVAAIESPA